MLGPKKGNTGKDKDKVRLTKKRGGRGKARQQDQKQDTTPGSRQDKLR
jgi:hypothetical protein